MIPAVPSDQPPIGWPAWLREIARAVNLLSSNANNPPAGTGGGGTITLSGDVTGSGTSAITASVVRLQSRPVSATAPTGSQVLQWSGSAWAPATISGGGGAVSGMVAGQIPIPSSATAITSSGNLSGDISTANSLVTTLATVNANIGTFQGITVNAKGLVTAAVNQGYLTNATASGIYAPIISPNFTGTPTAPTNAASPAPGSNSTVIATTAFVTNAVATAPPSGLTTLTGDVTAGPGTGSQAATIANSAVTLAKMQNRAASTLLGNPTGSAAAPGEITLGANLTFAGSVLNAASGGSGTINGVTAGPGLAGGGTTGTVTLSTSVPSVTKTGNYTVVAADLGTTLVLGGATLILTLPAGIFTPGSRLGIVVVSSGTWNVTNSTGLTLNSATGQTTSTLQPGTSGTFIANTDGTSLNFVPGVQPPSTTILGGVKALAPVANNFLTGITSLSGAVTAAQPTIGNLANIAATTLVGNPTGSAAAPSAITLGTNLSFAGTVLNAASGLSGMTAGQIAVAGSATTVTSSIANGQLPATATNDNAAAGKLGEYIASSITAGTAISNATALNLTTITLTAGDWDVTGAVRFIPAGTSTMSDTFCTISTTAANTSQTDFSACSFARHQVAYAAGVTGVEVPPPLRLSLTAASTTVYLVAFCQFAVSTCQVTGILRARRVR